MTNKILDETIDYLGILAKLELTDEERKKAEIDLNKMVRYIEKLGEINTDNIEPMKNVFENSNVFRDDVILSSEKNEDMLANAPENKKGLFVVPKAVQ